MNEKTLLELLDSIQSAPPEFRTIQPRLKQFAQAIDWAEQSERWDVVIKLAGPLVHLLAYTNFEVLNAEEENTQFAPEVIQNFWEQGCTFAKQGLIAARKTANKDWEIGFLKYLSRLSGYLDDFEMAIKYLKQVAKLVPELKLHAARELLLLGKQASNVVEDYAAARTCYQASLEIVEELGNKYAIAETLAWMGVNEERLNNPEMAQQLFRRSTELRAQLNETDKNP